MKILKKIWAVAGVAAITLILAACGSGSQSSSSSSTWNTMETDVIQTMDPTLATDVISGQALVNTMDGLYRYHGQKLQPAIATAVVTPTSNGTVYTYKLRDAKWSNGDDVTAEDFVYGWQRTVDPKNKSQYAYLYSGIKNADDIMAGKAAASTLGVKAVDKHTLQVTLDHAIPYFNKMITVSAFLPQNKKVVEKYGKEFGTNASDLVFNGPYMLKGWNGTGDSWKLVKNTKYWNAKNVHIQTINTQVVKSPSTALSLYQSKKLDNVALTGEQAGQAKTMKDFKGLKQSGTFYIELNEKKIPEFKNAKLRQAISLAINRDEYIKKVLNDSSIVAPNVTPAGIATVPSTDKDFSATVTETTKASTAYDPAKAKSLWEAGLKEVGKQSLSIELLTDDTDNAKRSAEYFQSALQESLPGLKINIVTVPFKTRLTRSQNGQFDIVISGWSADFPDPITFLDLFTTGNTYNNGKWSNAEYDRLIQASKTTDVNDATKRYDDLIKAQTILTQEEGVVPLYQRVEAHLVRNTIKNLQYGPTNTYDYVGATLK